MYSYIIWISSFLTLLFAFFWIMVLWLDEAEFDKLRKIKYFPHITLIIPTYNGAKTIEATIKSLLNSDYPEDKLDIIVAPNNCTDGTEEIVRALTGPRVKMKVIEVPKGKRGKAYAFNQILPLAKGEIIGWPDDDCLVESNTIRNLIPLFNDPKTAAAVSICKVYKPKTLMQKLQSIEYTYAALSRRLLSSVESLYVAPGVISLGRKKLIQKIGGMDEESLTEDLELAVHLNRAGYVVRSQIHSVAYTEAPATIGEFHKQRLRWMRGYLTTLLKHKDMLFNPKQGFLGAVFLPFTVVFLSLSSLLVAFLVYFMALRAYNTLYIFGVLRTQLSTFLSLNNRVTIFGINPIIFPSVLILLLAIYLLYKGYKHTGDKWQYPLATVLYFTFYQLLLSSYWLFALVTEGLGLKRTWGGIRDETYKKLREKGKVCR